MNAPIRVLVTLEKGADAAAIQEALPLYAGIHLVGLVDGLDEGWTTLQETDTDLLVIGCAGYSERVLFLIEGSMKQDPQRPIVVLSHGSTNGFMNRAFDAGADDFITLPEAPGQVQFAIEKAMARKRGAATLRGASLSPMICVLGPKGGTGKTLTACNLAVSLAHAGYSTVLVDLDLQFGDVGLSLGLAPETTVADLAKAGGSMDAEKLDAYLATHESGLRVLLAPTRPDQAATVGVELLRDVYSALRTAYDFVIVDTPPGFTPEVIASIDSSSHVCLVGMLDSLSLKNTKLGLETLDLMGYGADRVTLVLNRADTRVGISRDDVRTIVGRAPDVLVPSDRQIPISVNEGTPIALVDEKSDAAKAFQRLATVYIEAKSMQELPTNGVGKPSGLRRLLKRS